MTRSVKGLNLTELNCIQLGHQRLLEGDIRLLVSDQMDKTLHCCGVTLHNYLLCLRTPLLWPLMIAVVDSDIKPSLTEEGAGKVRRRTGHEQGPADDSTVWFFFTPMKNVSYCVSNGPC